MLRNVRIGHKNLKRSLTRIGHGGGDAKPLDYGDIAEEFCRWVDATLSEVWSFCLLETKVHACEKCSSYEGHLIDDKQDYVVPRIF